MRIIRNLILLIFPFFIVSAYAEKHFVYCIHTQEDYAHLEILNVTKQGNFIEGREIHLKVLENLNIYVEKLGKLVSVFYYLTVKDNFTFLPRIPSVFNKFTYVHDPPLSSVKLLI